MTLAANQGNNIHRITGQVAAVHGLAFPFRDQLFLAFFRAQPFRNTEINLRQLQRTANDSNQLWFNALQIFHCDD